MIFAVGADGMTFRENPPDSRRICMSHFSDWEKSSLYALRSENVENLVGIPRYWSVVEGKYDLLVGQRQGRSMIHSTNFGIFAGIDGKHSARSKRVGITRTILSPCQIAFRDDCNCDD